MFHPYSLIKFISPAWRKRLKRAFGSHGHAAGLLDHVKAARRARENKSLQSTILTLTNALDEIGIKNLEGKSCLEFGAGYVLSDATAMYLLGAKDVIATDIFPIFKNRALRVAIKVSDWDIILKKLEGRVSDSILRDRVQKVRAARSIEDIGIVYLAPLDASKERIQRRFDFIYSISVLEHIPPEDITGILVNLRDTLEEDGVMYHRIHLEDHFNFRDDPFAFLSSDSGYRIPQDYDARGNRIRHSQWIEYFRVLSDMEISDTERRQRDISLIPNSLIEECARLSKDDIAVSHVSIIARKVARPSTT